MKLVQLPDLIANLPFIRNYTQKANSSSMPLKKDAATIQIIQEYKALNQKDNKDWQDALEMANDPTNPKWDALQDMYDKLIVDSHTHSLMQLRETATLSTRNYILDEKGEEQPEKTAFFQSEWFYNFLAEVLQSIAKGYTVGQLINPQTMKFFYVPRRNYCPQKNMVRLKVGDDRGLILDDPAIADSMIVVRNNYMYGYMNDLVPLILWKLNTLMSWAEATEKYGLPPLIATTKSRDKKVIQDLNEMLKSAGETLTAVLPEGTTVSPMANYDKIDPEKMFGGLMKVCDEGIAKRIVGGTMISDNGSSRSQSQVHQANFDEKIIESDKRICEFVVNGQLIPMMIRNGWKLSETDKWQFDRSQKLTLKEHWDIVKGLLETHDVDEDWLKKTFQVPITGVKVKAAATAPTASFNNASNVFAAALEAKGVLLPSYIASCGHNHLPVASSIGSNILGDLADILLNDIFAGKDTLVTEVLRAIEGHRIFTEGLFDSWGDRRMSISYDATDNHCLAAMEYNLFEFSRSKENANVFALNELLIDKTTNNVRTLKEFRDLALPYLKNPDVNWLRAEYNHTVAVGQGASRYHQFMSERFSVTRYVIIQTVGDSNVRPAHQVLDGKIMALDAKGGLTIWTPFDIGCRCEILQYLGNVSKELLADSNEIFDLIGKKQGDKWTATVRNRTGITANEMYMKQLNLASETNKLTYNVYGNKKYDEIKGNYPALKLDGSITKQNVGELFNTVLNADYMGFKDYTGRNIVMKQSVFDDHTTTDKYIKQGRHQLFPHVDDVLNTPDEVYLFKRGKDNYQTNYVKFYNNKAVVVNTRLGKQNIEINTWYEMSSEADVRKGYLIRGIKNRNNSPIEGYKLRGTATQTFKRIITVQTN